MCLTHSQNKLNCTRPVSRALWMGKFIIQQRCMHNAVYAVEPLAHSSSNQGMVCGILLWRQKYDKCHHGAGACYCIPQHFGGSTDQRPQRWRRRLTRVETNGVVQMKHPSGSVFAYCKRSKTGTGEGLGTRLPFLHTAMNVKCKAITAVGRI